MKRHIHILHTNDIHSHLQRTPQISSVLRTLRREAVNRGDAAVTIDVGDHMDRMRVETEGTNGAVNVAIMDETGYDYITLGNNEGLTFPHDVLDHMYDQASFQVILSNWYDLKTNERPRWMLPYAIKEWFGCRVAFIAVTAPFNDFYRLLGWEVKNPFDTVRDLVSELRSDHRADVVVVLSHLGFVHDEQLAKTIPGIDVILGGHTHHLFEKIVWRDGTVLAATGKFGEFVGEVKLTVDSRTGKLLAISGGCRSVSGAQPDRRIVHLLNEGHEQAEQELSQPVVELKRALSIDWQGESPFGNLLADSLLQEVAADAAIVNSGQLLEGLPVGVVTRKDLHRICPSPINPCRIYLSGQRLRQALEESLLSNFCAMPIEGFGFRGKQLGSLAISGMNVTYEAEAPPYEKIRAIRIGDTMLEADKKYCIATIDMFTFGIGYLSLKDGENVEFYLPDFLRDLLARQLRKADNVAQAFCSRWDKI